MCVRARLRARAPLGATLYMRGRLFSSAICLLTPDCSSLQNRRPPGFQLGKRRRRNSSLETPFLGASNSALGSGALSRVPLAGAHSRAPGDVLGFALLRPRRGWPARGAKISARGGRAAVSGSRCEEAGASLHPRSLAAGAVLAALSCRISHSFLLAQLGDPALHNSRTPGSERTQLPSMSLPQITATKAGVRKAGRTGRP